MEKMDQEMQEEMIGILTAIGIVTNRLAKRLKQLGCEKTPDKEKVR